jgi:hypothetical protein
MKIYIDNYNIDDLPKKMKTLSKHLTNKTNAIEVYSDEGIFVIDEQNIRKVAYLDKPIKRGQYINETGRVFDLLMDHSETTMTLVNQLPTDNVILKIETQIYQITANSKTKLVIKSTLNKVTNEYNPCDFYFELPNDIDISNPIFTEDINVFLFHLN